MKALLSRTLSRALATSPLRHAQFRLFFFGSVGTAIGYTMQTTIAAWVMATLTTSELMIALVQTASTAPTLLCGLVAGALADIVDRRKLLLATQGVLLVSTAALGASTIAGIVGPAALLALTFLVGAGLSLYLPAQAASVNDLVARQELPRAVALQAVAFNSARAIGPALAGGLAAWLSSGSAFLIAALCFTAMIAAARRMATERSLPGVPETVLSGVASGLRFARHSLPMRSLIIRAVSFTLCASVFWALLPVIARSQLALGAGGFGLLSAGFGSGAVAAALWVPSQLQSRSLQTVVTWGAVAWIGAIGLLAITDLVVVAILCAAVGGAAWVSVLASLSAGTQSIAPAWVRARAVAVQLVATQASMAIGSAFWGALASTAGSRMALAGSAAALLLLLVVTRQTRVAMGDEGDVTPSSPPSELAMAAEPRPDDGPVLIQLQYRINGERVGEFLQSLHAVEPVRRRNGASSWRVFRDLAEEGLFVERFIVESWAEYVRLRGRATVADRDAQHRVEQFQRADIPVRVSRLIGIDRRDTSSAEPAMQHTNSASESAAQGSSVTVPADPAKTSPLDAPPSRD